MLCYFVLSSDIPEIRTWNLEILQQLLVDSIQFFYELKVVQVS